MIAEAARDRARVAESGCGIAEAGLQGSKELFAAPSGGMVSR